MVFLGCFGGVAATLTSGVALAVLVLVGFWCMVCDVCVFFWDGGFCVALMLCCCGCFRACQVCRTGSSRCGE